LALPGSFIAQMEYVVHNVESSQREE
jgi:hypothetical protein